MGMQNRAATLEDHLAVSYKVQPSLTKQPSHTPRHLSNWIENYVHTKVCPLILIVILFIIIPNWKQPRYSSIGEQIKQTVVQPYNGLLVLKRNELSIHEKRNGGTLNAYYQVKEASLERPHALIPTIESSGKRQNYRDHKGFFSG